MLIIIAACIMVLIIVCAMCVFQLNKENEKESINNAFVDDEEFSWS